MDAYYVRYSKKSKSKVKILRKNMTKEERHLWYDFLKIYPVKIYRQKAIENYIVDFYCSKALLVIEIDGSQHFTDDGLEYDAVRTDVLEHHNIKVIRFTNLDINREFENVCATIDREIQRRLKEFKVNI